MQTKRDLTEAGRALVDIEDLEVHFQLRGGNLRRLFGMDTGTVKAVDGVNLSLKRGEVLGLVGESGSGKTTLGRAILGLAPSTTGSITYHERGEDGQVTDRVVSELRGAELRKLRTDLQMVFQDPHAALNPSMNLETAVGHPLKIHGIASGEPSFAAGSPQPSSGSVWHRPNSSCRSTLRTSRAGRSSERSSRERSSSTPRCSSPTSRCRCWT